jgi:hypothetical protein
MLEHIKYRLIPTFDFQRPAILSTVPLLRLPFLTHSLSTPLVSSFAIFSLALNSTMLATMGSASELPPFPKDVPTLPLLRISLQKLLDHDDEEVKRLVDACEDNGFFYLHVQDTVSHSSILDDVDKLFAIGEEFFALSFEEKQKYDFRETTPYFGYKQQGSSVIDRTGKRDQNESYNVLNHAPFSYSFGYQADSCSVGAQD